MPLSLPPLSLPPSCPPGRSWRSRPQALIDPLTSTTDPQSQLPPQPAAPAPSWLPPPTWLPPAGARLGTTLVAGAHLHVLAQALAAGGLMPLGLSWPGSLDGVLGWGAKPSGRRAQRAALRRNLPFWSVEDGFLRSVGLGKEGAPSLSYVLDDCGIYYEAAVASRLERIIAGAVPDAAETARTQALLARLAAQRLSKYNHLADHPVALADHPVALADHPVSLADPPAGPGAGPPPRRILLVDQTAGDRSIAGALAGPDAFARMIGAARAQHPQAQLVFKTHPDTAAGLAGSAAGAAGRAAGLEVVSAAVSPHALFDAVDAVWTVSSQTGFEALLAGLPVVTFGVPFYAGWGLTDDRAGSAAARAVLARRAATPRSLVALAHAALIAYPVYVDPGRGCRVTPEQGVDMLVAWRGQARRIGRDHLCVGFSRWKQPHARAYLGAAGGVQRFASQARALAQAGPQTHVVAWGMKADDAFAAAVRRRGGRFSRLEDGFVRSVGLGSNFLFPWSLCLDDTGLYYQAGRPSDLEALLNGAPVAPDLAARAKTLRQRLVALGITKYNLSGAPPASLRAQAQGRPVLLVIGQVPADFSIRLGMVLPAGNLDFLQKVRAGNPAAFIVYKEHPDVVSGNRPGRSDPAALAQSADMVVLSGDSGQWSMACDHVHVMTSLVGFEALLRQKPVTCWGAPFFSGWGLTVDKVFIARRTARLALDDLVACALIIYPLYRTSDAGLPCSIEDVLDAFEARNLGRTEDTGQNQDTGQIQNPAAAVTGYGIAEKSSRLLSYAAAQLAAWLGQRPGPRLRAAAGTGWPFFRRVPDRAGKSRLQSGED